MISLTSGSLLEHPQFASDPITDSIQCKCETCSLGSKASTGFDSSITPIFWNFRAFTMLAASSQKFCSYLRWVTSTMLGSCRLRGRVVSFVAKSMALRDGKVKLLSLTASANHCYKYLQAFNIMLESDVFSGQKSTLLQSSTNRMQTSAS